MPPGEVPSRTRPTARGGSSEKAWATAKASRGESRAKLKSPIHTPLGLANTRLKSAGVSDIPRLPMITASARGSRTVTKIESCMAGRLP